MLDSPGTATAPGLLGPGAVPARGGFGRWLKPFVSVSLYALIFWFTDARAILGHMADARLEYVAAGVLLYAAGQALSTWKWRLLLRPVGLGAVRYTRLLAFYFIGMFFNLFLPTVVGGDAVKALLLARETGSPSRATTSVFMERNLGLFALLAIALVAAWRAPTVDIMGVTLSTYTLLLFAGFVAVNLVLATRGVYGLVDRIIAARRSRACVCARRRSTRRSRRTGRSRRVIAGAVLLSFIFQGVVIAVVFLNARALDLQFPISIGRRIRAAHLARGHDSGQRQRARRTRSPLHLLLRPARGVHRGVGVAGVAVPRGDLHREPARGDRVRTAALRQPGPGVDRGIKAPELRHP